MSAEPAADNPTVYRFGEFEADVRSRELRRVGRKIPLQDLPFQLLCALLRRPGEIVTREELRHQLWPDDVFVDFEDGLNTAVRKLRLALDDSAEEPRYIETVPRRGYRFIASVAPARSESALPRTPRAAIYVVTLIAVLILGAALIARRSIATREPRNVLQQITHFTDSVRWPAISPDGRMIAFVRGPEGFGPANPADIYLKLEPHGEATPITNSPAWRNRLAFSPDGSKLAFTLVDKNFSWDTWEMSLPGGTPRLWMPNASGLTWIDDEHVLFSEIKSGIHMGVVTATIDRRESRDVYLPASEVGMAHNAHLSPDRKWVLVVEMESGIWLPCRLVPFDGTSKGRQVGPPRSQCTAAAWSPDGEWMYFVANTGSGSHIWRQRFPEGPPEQLTFGPTEEEGLAVSSDGRSLLTASGLTQSTIWWNDGEVEMQISHEGNAYLPLFSFDGTKIYYLVGGHRTRPFVSGELWMFDVTSRRRQIVLPGRPMTHYSVSHDGKLLAFTAADSDGRGSVWIASLDPPSAARRISSSNETRVFFTPEGELISLAAEGSAKYVFRMRGDGSRRRKAFSDPVLNLISVSPDGQTLIIWTPTSAGKTFTAVKAFSIDGASRVTLCTICTGGDFLTHSRVASWSTDEKYMLISFQHFPGMRLANTTFMLPLPPGSHLPVIPDTGIASEADLASIPGVRTIRDRRVTAGPNGSYAAVRVSALRNLYRVRVH